MYIHVHICTFMYIYVHTCTHTVEKTKYLLCLIQKIENKMISQHHLFAAPA